MNKLQIFKNAGYFELSLQQPLSHGFAVTAPLTQWSLRSCMTDFFNRLKPRRLFRPGSFYRQNQQSVEIIFVVVGDLMPTKAAWYLKNTASSAESHILFLSFHQKERRNAL